MNARLFLRSAAVITLLLTVGHMLGSPWTPVHTPPGLAVVTAMKSYHFPAMGFERTYYEFYVGFGWLLGAYAAAHAVIFWQLAGLSSQFPGKLRPVVAVLCLEAVCAALLEWKFLFWAPIVFSAATAACLGVAWRLMRPGTAALGATAA
jgi:hypothetical protein